MTNDTTHEPATKGYVRLKVMEVATLLGIILLGYAMLNQVGNTTRSRAQCERGNERNVAQLRLYHDLDNANTSRIKAVQRARRRYLDPLKAALVVGGVDPALAEVVLYAPDPNIYARHQYRIDRASFIEAQASTAIAPHADRPNGVRVDCDSLYPFPEPINTLHRLLG